MELIIALEMSRLQMIEDRMKQANAITPDPSSSISNHSTESNDDQLKLAIQLSLQDSTPPVVKEEGNTSSSTQGFYQKTSADITVDNFLKSLANQRIDLNHFEVNLNMLNTDLEKNEKEYFFKPCNGSEDGRFQISDIHENGFAFADEDDFVDDNVRLKRSHSTGDLGIRRSSRGMRVRLSADEPRYHLDSDHSIQHDDKPEEVVRKTLVLPKTKHFLLHRSHAEEGLYEGQSSVEDTTTTTTTTSESINADLEVSGILEDLTNDEEPSKQPENISKSDEKRPNPFASLKAKLCSTHLAKTRIAVNKSIGLLSEPKGKKVETEDSRRNSDHFVFKQKLSLANEYRSKKEPNVSKSTSFLLDAYSKIPKQTSANLRIKICKNPVAKTTKPLETDSSNEYESETGIPKSPTLFISGVSISRTPEPKSPGLSIAANGRQSRSSSLSVPVPLSSCSLNISSNSLNNTLPPEPFTPSLVRSSTPAASRSNVQSPKHHSPGKENSTKSKSASEPEREKEVFRFPKSSTDGALSSVLHVQESNLSSDDFHEALFLLERSPKSRDSKRRKRSKKKEKEKEEASSAL